MGENKSSNDGGCCGCITLVLFILAVWALLFGVTIDGKRYGLSACSVERGLEIDR